MSWVRIWVHLVFTTKNREPYFHSPELRKKVFQHIKQNSEEKGIFLDSISGYSEHIHSLVSLDTNQSISKVAQLIKGESAFWINQNKLTKTKFMWQDDYWAVGISESHLEAVRTYIQNQEVHHSKKLFSDEIDDFMKKYGYRW